MNCIICDCQLLEESNSKICYNPSCRYFFQQYKKENSFISRLFKLLIERPAEIDTCYVDKYIEYGWIVKLNKYVIISDKGRLLINNIEDYLIESKKKRQ